MGKCTSFPRRETERKRERESDTDTTICSESVAGTHYNHLIGLISVDMTAEAMQYFNENVTDRDKPKMRIRVHRAYEDFPASKNYMGDDREFHYPHVFLGALLGIA